MRSAPRPARRYPGCGGWESSASSSCSRGAITAAAGSIYHESIARLHLGFVGAPQFEHRTVLAFNMISAERAGSASCHPVGRDAAVAGEDGGGHRFAEP